MSQSPHARTENIVIQEMGKEMLAYDLILNRAFHLNETSTLVWSFCDGRSSAAEIAWKMSAKLRQPITEEFVLIAIDQLKKDKLLENADQISVDFSGQNRREMIRRVGAASLVALPMILSLVAPKASMAQSTCNSYATSCGDLVFGPCCPGLTCLGPNSVISRCCIGPGGSPDLGILGCSSSAVSCSNAGATQCCSGQATLTSASLACAPGNTCQCTALP